VATDWPDAREAAWRAGAAAWAAATGAAAGNAYNARHGAARTTSLGLAEAAGRTLAAAVIASTDLPAFDSSAMDGWVVAGQPPWLIGQPIAAGDDPGLDPLAAGEARPISTGGPVPAGALGILRSEDGEIDGDRLTVGGGALAITPGRHVRRAGEEARAGDVLINAGALLTPPRIAIAAISGVDSLAVIAEPDVEFVLLGSEIVGAGTPAAGQVRDAFGPQLPTFVAALGARPARIRRVGDSLDQTIAAFAASSSPLTVSTGGTARGMHDHVRGALESLGATLLIDGVAVRPGHPVLLARLPDARLVLCLPGNPLAAMLTLAGIGAAVIAGLLGRPLAALGSATLAAPVENSGANTLLVPCVAVSSSNADPAHAHLGVVPATHQGSGMLRGLAEAQLVAVIPPGGAAAGPVQTLPLPW
jgi:molybdopterin molybdotransferase